MSGIVSNIAVGTVAAGAGIVAQTVVDQGVQAPAITVAGVFAVGGVAIVTLWRRQEKYDAAATAARRIDDDRTAEREANLRNRIHELESRLDAMTADYIAVLKRHETHLRPIGEENTNAE